MDFANKTSYEIAFALKREGLEELRKQALVKTIKELAEENNVTYGKMSIILRLTEIKAKRPEIKRKPRAPKPKVPKLPKKDHAIASWASSFNRGRIRYVYYDMINRCYKSSNRGYKDYGGRGISVCDEWRKDCCNFYKWAKDNGYAEGLQLDRKDNNGNYCPENCHFVTPSDNGYNKRNTRLITYNGKTMNLREWSKETGISKYVLADRLYKYKWDIERALTQPVK